MSEQVVCMGASIPLWLVVIAVVVLVGFSVGGWAKVWAIAKAQWTAWTGKVIASDNWLDAVAIPVLRTYKVQQALRVALREFEAKGDAETVAALQKAIATAATWTED